MSQKIDSDNLDVIVIGAGPAGGQAARELAKRGRKVLLIERSQEIGQPNYSTAGTIAETIEKYSLPQDIISAEWDSIFLTTSRERAFWKFPQTAGYVLDFVKLRRFLAEDAAAHGAEIMIGTSVQDFIKKGDEIIGVHYRGSIGEGEARAKIIIDATGHNEFANTKLSANSVNLETLGTAMEYVMTNLPAELSSSLGFYVGSEYAHTGYSWIFPSNRGHEGRVGTCSAGPLPESMTLDQLQKKFVSSFDFCKGMEPLEIHAGAARADGGVKNHVFQNVVIIGDAAHQVNPLGGEGIRHCLNAGCMAAEVIDGWIARSASMAALKKEYEKRWRKEFGLKWKVANKLMRSVYKYNDKQWDVLIKAAGKLTPQQLASILFHYQARVIIENPSLALLLIN
jgi:digeranylgeranylglycerophospholipid reductase